MGESSIDTETVNFPLLGALEHYIYMTLMTFPSYWEWNVIIPNDFHSIIFQRGRAQPPTSPAPGRIPQRCSFPPRMSLMSCHQVDRLQRAP